jgi:hypothetical protein
MASNILEIILLIPDDTEEADFFSLIEKTQCKYSLVIK